MEYLISFIEGIITFVSPCMLPMLPIYVSYFAGVNNEGSEEESSTKTAINALGFVLGFSITFIMLGVMAASFGKIIGQYGNILNIICGSIVVLLGLSFLGVIKLDFIKLKDDKKFDIKKLNFFSSILFGMVFSISWTPCVSAFLGSALMLAVNSQTALQGGIMLALFSLGLGIPFIISAILIDRFKNAFNFIKRHYGTINKISGILLIVMGIMMMLGWFNLLLAFFTI